MKPSRSSKNQRRQNLRESIETFIYQCRDSLGRMIPAVALFLVMVALPVVAQTTWYYLATSPVFTLTHIEVEGNHGLSTEEILKITKIYTGENLIDTDVTGIREEILATGWVETLHIEKELPDTLRITVKEHMAVATLLTGGLSMIDEAGKIFRTILPGESVPRPVITGIQNPDDPQQARLLERALAIRGLYEKSGLLKFDQLAEITHDYVRGFSITTEQYRMIVHLGHKDHGRNIRRLRFAVHDAIDRGLGVPLEVHADLGQDRLVILPSTPPGKKPSKLAWRDDKKISKHSKSKKAGKPGTKQRIGSKSKNNASIDTTPGDER